MEADVADVAALVGTLTPSFSLLLKYGRHRDFMADGRVDVRSWAMSESVSLPYLNACRLR